MADQTLPTPVLPTMALFALASVMPMGLLAAGAFGAGVAGVAGLLWITLFAATLDQAVPWVAPDAPEGAEFPGSDALLVAIGVLHLAAVPLAIWAVAGDSGLKGWERGVLAVGFGLWFGQVANPAAHELIHRGDRRLFRLGAAIYSSLLFGHHASAHRLVHHRHAASRDDPNTARSGEGYYRFFLRAWAGSFRAGWQAERARARGLHPYVWYLAGSLLTCVCAYGVAGGWGVAAWAAMALHAQSQLLLSDYVQHYGLTRARDANGRLEPVGDRHSWNAPHWASAAMMLNAPRHSDHHAHPSRPYPALRLPAADDAPRLPYALPVCCVVALVPPVWRRMMAPRLARWR
jgi:alkane 1-monooxygenase